MWWITGGIPLGVKAGTTKKKKKKKVEGEDVEGAIVEEAVLGKGMLWYLHVHVLFFRNRRLAVPLHRGHPHSKSIPSMFTSTELALISAVVLVVR